MGNKPTNNFAQLDDIPNEKSLYSYNVKLVEISDKNKVEMNKNIKYKLKLYPSTLTLKNEREQVDFSYYDILSWGKSKQFFTFKTKENIIYSFITDTNDTALDIVSSLKEICTNIANENNINK